MEYICKTCPSTCILNRGWDDNELPTQCPWEEDDSTKHLKPNWMGPMLKLDPCPDCGVAPGQIHKMNCDVERCSGCGDQYISCDCRPFVHDEQFARWTGFWPGKLEAQALGIDLNQFYEEGYHKRLFAKPESDEDD
jgi:hypothetical protein